LTAGEPEAIPTAAATAAALAAAVMQVPGSGRALASFPLTN